MQLCVNFSYSAASMIFNSSASELTLIYKFIELKIRNITEKCKVIYVKMF